MIKMQELQELKHKPLPAAINKELERLGLTQVGGAEVLRIDPRTMRRYLQEPGTDGSAAMPFPMFALLKNLKP